jgi:hypothetical protein
VENACKAAVAIIHQHAQTKFKDSAYPPQIMTCLQPQPPVPAAAPVTPTKTLIPAAQANTVKEQHTAHLPAQICHAILAALRVMDSASQARAIKQIRIAPRAEELMQMHAAAH